MKRLLAWLHGFAATYRVHITFAVMGALLLNMWREGRLPRDPADLSDPVALWGVVLALVGVAVRSWAAGLLRKSETVVDVGPYSLTRHPLYVGSALMALGIGLVLGDWRVVAALLAIFLLVYLPRIQYEEGFLADLFPSDWPAYKERTGLFWPRTLRPALRSGWSGAVWLHNREYKAALTVLAVLVILHFIAR